MTDIAAELKAVASDAKAWPFAEARDLVKRLDGMGHGGEVLFETGYGPSGLPHIGAACFRGADRREDAAGLFFR